MLNIVNQSNKNILNIKLIVTFQQSICYPSTSTKEI